jgi:peptide/nickel transport system ATP-binding protein
MTLLEVSDLNVRFPTEDGTVHAVRGVSFKLDHGDVLGVVGESGCGKSVTAMALMGLLPRSAKVDGSIKFEGEEIVGLKRNELVRFRGNRIGIIFQDPMTSLNPVYSVGWQLGEAIQAHNKISKKAALARAVELLQVVGIPEPHRRVKNFPHEFSGGMRQRVMIAMAMANDPQVLIADEPTTALDVTVQAQILETLVRVKDELNAAIILITHDLGVVASMADRVQVMYAGAVVESGTVDDIFYRTRMPYTAGLLGAIPSVTGSDGGRLNQIKGSTPSLIRLKPGCPFSSRCPLVTDVCLTSEPPLSATDGPGHIAACHRWEELVGVDGRLLFHEEVTA